MSRLLCAPVLFAAATAAAAPVPVVPQDPTKDREGNPLPKGATARLGSLAYRGPVMYGLTFSPDGKKLLSASEDGRVFAWDADTGKPLPARPFESLDGGRFSLSGAVAGDRVVWLTKPTGGGRRPDCTAATYDLSGGEVSRFPVPAASPDFNVISHRTWDASVTPDGKYLAAITDERKGVAAYDLDAGKELFRHGLKDAGGAGVHLSPDGKALYLCGAGGPVQRFELPSGKELEAVADTDRMIDLILASPDGKQLVTRGTVLLKDEKGNVRAVGSAKQLVVRDVTANKTLGTLDVGGHPADFRFAGPGVLVVLTYRPGPAQAPVYAFSRWDLATRKREWEVPAPDGSAYLAASDDGKRFAATNRACVAHVYDAATGKPVAEPAAHPGAVAWVGFSPDGGRVFTAGPDGFRTWTPAGERKGAEGLTEWAGRTIPYFPFGEHLVWVTRPVDGKGTELVGWDRAKGEIGWRAAVDGPAPERVLTHDGRRCVGVSYNGKARAWDVAVYDGPGGKKLHAWTFTHAPSGGFHTWPPLAVTTDGSALLVGGDGITGLDVATGKEKFKIAAGPLKSEGAPGPFPMAVSADGARVAVVAERAEPRATVLRVFEVKSGKKLAEHDLGRVYLPALRFSPNGKQVAVWNVWGPVVQVCDAGSDAAPPRKLEGGNGRATAAAFSPDGKSLVVGYQDGTALVWDLSAK